jgi:hypothetical protein
VDKKYNRQTRLENSSTAHIEVKLQHFIAAEHALDAHQSDEFPTYPVQYIHRKGQILLLT